MRDKGQIMLKQLSRWCSISIGLGLIVFIAGIFIPAFNRANLFSYFGISIVISSILIFSFGIILTFMEELTDV